MRTRNQSEIRARAVATALAAAAVFALPGCAGGTDNHVSDSGGPITVWVDPPRVPAVDAFRKAYPDIPVQVTTINGNVGSTELQQKFVLFNQAGKGWPDAIFFPSNDDIAWAASSKINYVRDIGQNLGDIIPEYPASVIAQCRIDGRVRCLRNDAAPDVLWYDAELFRQWGYLPPATWEDYERLSLAIAQDHPGYLTGFLGDAYAPDRYLWASGCPTNERISEKQVRIELTDNRCTRIRDLLTRLVDAGAVSPSGIFSPDAAALGRRLAMSPGAVWWGNFLFRDTWKVDPGRITAAAPLRWAGDDAPATSSEGGGLWGFSRHITGVQLQNTLTFARFVATDPRWQVELSVGLPAYGPLQQPWLTKQRQAGYLAKFDTAAAAFVLASTIVRSGRDYTRYNTGTVWTHTITPALTSGQPFARAWDTFGQRLTSEARSFGYAVRAGP
ncbi:extracellular solute-binding protein [Dactylosporangium darangshiense]|uniref:Extracellular solute-binding protein n=1 Tax=Dactylosporangium darangshiense TaxID=579108 RepID=A0ABP8DBR0_9ACTN